MKKLFLIVFVLLFAQVALAQGLSSSTTARRVRGGSALPATCRAANPIDVFIKTGASAGFYFCSATNTWTGPLPTTTTAPGGSSGDIQYNNAGAFGGLSSTGAGNAVRASSPSVANLTATGANDTTPLTVTGGSITGSGTLPFLDISGTWNTSGLPTGIRSNLTNTASAANSLLIDLRSDAVSRFRVTAAGILGNFGSIRAGSTPDTGTATANMSGSSGSYQMIAGGSIAWSNNTTNVVGTTLDTGIARVSAGVIKITDAGSGYGKLSLAASVTWSSGAGSPEGVVTANIGSLYTRTDGSAGTTLYVKESGTSNTGWVAK